MLWKVGMPKRTPRIRLRHQTWGYFRRRRSPATRIERAFGHRLTSDVWEQVGIRTSLLTAITPIEGNAARDSQMSRKFDKLIQVASSLGKDLSADFAKSAAGGVQLN